MEKYNLIINASCRIPTNTSKCIYGPATIIIYKKDINLWKSRLAFNGIVNFDIKEILESTPPIIKVKQVREVPLRPSLSNKK